MGEEQNSEDSEGDQTLTGEEIEGVLTIRRMRAGSAFRVPVTVQGHPLHAVVDTAAEVTLISEETYKSLGDPPPVLREVIMNTAGRGLQMNGFIVGPTVIGLGPKQIQTEIYVAPIEDDMLLGFDVLRRQGVELNMGEGQLRMGADVVPMTLGGNPGNLRLGKSLPNKRLLFRPTQYCELVATWGVSFQNI